MDSENTDQLLPLLLKFIVAYLINPVQIKGCFCLLDLRKAFDFINHGLLLAKSSIMEKGAFSFTG
jgi:hypothetical protein